MPAVEFSLAELADLTGCTARTLRFYIARGLLPGPDRAGRSAVYSQHHLQRIREIRKAQAEGRTLAEIAAQSTGSSEKVLTPPGTPVWIYRIAEDVTVQVRSDIAPWRQHQLQRALAEFAQQISPPHYEK